MPLETCATHGRPYDSSKASGCVLCLRLVRAQVPAATPQSAVSAPLVGAALLFVVLGGGWAASKLTGTGLLEVRPPKGDAKALRAGEVVASNPAASACVLKAADGLQTCTSTCTPEPRDNAPCRSKCLSDRSGEFTSCLKDIKSQDGEVYSWGLAPPAKEIWPLEPYRIFSNCGITPGTTLLVWITVDGPEGIALNFAVHGDMCAEMALAGVGFHPSGGPYSTLFAVHYGGRDLRREAIQRDEEEKKARAAQAAAAREAKVASVVMGSKESKDLLATAVSSDDSDLVSMLLARGADANWDSDKRGLILHVAAYSASPEMVRLLLERGARVDERGSFNNTALIQASENGRNETPVIMQMLLDHGANIEARDEFGNTALHHAVRHEKMENVQYLLSRGADINARGDQGRTPLGVELADKCNSCPSRPTPELDAMIEFLEKSGGRP